MPEPFPNEVWEAILTRALELPWQAWQVYPPKRDFKSIEGFEKAHKYFASLVGVNRDQRVEVDTIQDLEKMSEEKKMRVR